MILRSHYKLCRFMFFDRSNRRLRVPTGRMFRRWCLVSLTLLLTALCGLAVHLPLGDINLVVLTDDHSWVGGHGAHESLDADYGDVLSFYERLVSAAETDVFLVHNGDWIDGTGLSTYPPVHLEPILLKMPWDAVTVGNHDIYKNETVSYITRPGGLVEKLSYLTSNVIHASTGQPIGHRYRYLRGRNATILTLGFMYNLNGVGSPLVRVERAEDVVRKDWFTKVLRTGEYDAILVLAHMGNDDPSIRVILSAIRNETCPKMPVQFVTGHTHHRRFDVLDDWSTAVEAGCYLDTIGFVSFPTKQTCSSIDNAAASKLFQHDFIDAKVDALESCLGVLKLKTENGQALTDFIHKTQRDMGLSNVVGCSPRTYYMNRSLHHDDSLFGLWSREVIATQFIANDTKRVVLQGTSSSFRYVLFEGNVTLDDLIIVSPFNDSMYLVSSNVPTATILKLNETMNRKRNTDLFGLADYILIGDLIAHELHDLYTLEYEVPFIKRALEEISGSRLEPKQVDGFATSLWLSFLKSCWQSCSHIGCNNDDPETTTEQTTKIELDDGILNFFEKRSGTVTPAPPGNVAVFVAVASAAIAIFLLGRFTLRRLPSQRRPQPTNKLTV